MLGLACPCYFILGTIAYAILSSSQAYNLETSVGGGDEAKNKTRKPMAILKSAVRAPKSLYEGLRASARYIRAEYHITLALCVQESGLSPDEIVLPLVEKSILAPAIHVLGESLNIYATRHSQASIDDLCEQAVKTIRYVNTSTTLFRVVGKPMDKVWKLSFKDDIGSAIARSILAIINQPTNQLSFFDWISGSPITNSLPISETNDLRLSNADLQSRIRERIAQLSRWEVQGTPMAQYMRHVSFGIPPKQSQEEIERTIEDIWSICGPLMTQATHLSGK